MPGPTCSVEVDKIAVKSFRLLIPASQLQVLTNSTTIIRVHVCECFLMGGDLQKCALDAVTKAAQQVQVSPQDAAALDGRIFVLIDDSADFAKVYSALISAYPPPTPSPAWRILHGGAPPGGVTEPPSQPPSPPPGGSKPSPVGERSCKISSTVCIEPKTDEASAEFELKCEGLPPIVFSTDGKAGLKIGPLEVSLSVGGSDKH
jgi:hypothetical protein